jgi:hypothetical protein
MESEEMDSTSEVESISFIEETGKVGLHFESGVQLDYHIFNRSNNNE